jgi:hypothetical protein
MKRILVLSSILILGIFLPACSYVGVSLAEDGKFLVTKWSPFGHKLLRCTKIGDAVTCEEIKKQ